MFLISADLNLNSCVILSISCYELTTLKITATNVVNMMFFFSKFALATVILLLLNPILIAKCSEFDNNFEHLVVESLTDSSNFEMTISNMV